jgi:hypothetical protein
VANARRRHLRLVHADSLGATADARHQLSSRGGVAETGHPVAASANVVFTDLSGTVPFSIVTCGTTYDFDPVPALDRPAVDAPTDPSTPPRYLEAVDERPSGHLSRLRQRLHRGTLGRLLRVALLGDSRERPISRPVPDGIVGTSNLRDDRVRDSVRADRRSAQLLRCCRLAAVGLRIGPSRVW